LTDSKARVSTDADLDVLTKNVRQSNKHKHSNRSNSKSKNKRYSKNYKKRYYLVFNQTYSTRLNLM